MKNKFFALAMIAIMIIGIISGCSGNSDRSNSSAPPDSSLAPTTTPSSDSSLGNDTANDALRSDVTLVPFDGFDVPDNVSMPIASEMTTISAWAPYTSDYFTDINEAANYIEGEKRTNVHVDFRLVSTESQNESFNLMVNSGDYADMIWGSEMYVGGGVNGVTNGVFLKLNDMIDKYCPNYNAMRNYSNEHKRLTISNDGTIWAFYRMAFESELPFFGVIVRQDMLDKIGAERPATYDEYETVMDRFKNELATTYGIGIPANITDFLYNGELSAAFGVNNTWYQVDGKVKFGPMEPTYKDYVTKMNDWYNKGYIRQDFYTPQGFAYITEVINNDMCRDSKVGIAIGNCIFGSYGYEYGFTTNPDLFITALKAPVLNQGDVTHLRQKNNITTTGTISISTQAKDPVLCAKWIDYRYSYEGMLLNLYGVDGLTYFSNDDGSITYSKILTDDEEGLAFETAMKKHLAFANSGFGCVVDWNFNLWSFDPEFQTERAYWAEMDASYAMPSADYVTADDSATFSSTFADIQTYINEMITKFIIGTEPLEDYDDFVNQLESMGIEKCIEIKQAAVDAYYAR